ncbi:Rap1a/Tai family immunity protein [Phenylobacterium sp.]|uniref:Rap1a/Tai family immunity protein n=1 Tax=Phenylobacterium sp. TaxID=1871053 RepID=UPI00286A123F|nr:Rap1a/Tai family immunity protein [Phenylobacterium sp.]
MIWLILLATGVVSAAPTVDLRGYVDGQQLYDRCRPDSADHFAELRAAVCLGYVIGSADQILAVEADKPPQFRSFCPPQALIAEELRDTTLEFLERYPLARGAAAATVVAAALAERHPCDAPRPTDR